jgi:hypothetical protein
VLRWLGAVLGSAGDRTLAGGLLLTELATAARAEGIDLAVTLNAAESNLPAREDQALLPGLPQGANLAEFESLPPNHLGTLIGQLAREQRRHLMGRPFTSRIEISDGLLRLFLRHEHLITQLANPAQPKIILDATVNAGLLRAIFPHTPMHIERPPRADQATVIQVITRDWAKSTLHGARRTQWYDTVAQHIRPGRPTLVVCTQAAEDDLRRALRARGHLDAVVAHYGALRGSNDYKGYDVILAQVYHPNLDALVREGRALFADDPEPLDEQLITSERSLTDASGVSWVVPVVTFADARLAALLESRREAELVQCALRGRPLDHPEAQITLLFGLPLPGLEPTVVREGDASPQSNAGRESATRALLIDATRQLLDGGARVVSVERLATETGVSVVTIRKHWEHLATQLHLRSITQRRSAPLARGGKRDYARQVLVRRGRWVPPSPSAAPARAPDVQEEPAADAMMDQARNKSPLTRLIRRPRPMYHTSRTPRATLGSRPRRHPPGICWSGCRR